MPTLRDVAAEVLTSEESKRGELLTALNAAFDNTHKRYKKKNSGFEKAFQYNGVFSTQYPLSCKRDKTIAKAYDSVKALERLFKEVSELPRVTSTRTLTIPAIEEESEKTIAINKTLQDIQAKLRTEDVTLNQQYLKNTEAYKTFIAAREKLNELYDSLKVKASTNAFPDSLFKDQSLKPHFRTLDKELDNLQEFYERYEKAVSKKLTEGHKLHPSLDLLLTETKALVDSYYQLLSEKEESIVAQFNAINQPYQKLVESARQYGTLSRRLLNACSFRQKSRPPYNTIRELTNIFEVLQPLKENVAACISKRRDQLQAIPIKTGWVAKQISIEEEALRSLKTIEELVLREHDKAEAIINAIDEEIAENHRRLRHLSRDTKDSLVGLLADIQGRLDLVKQLGLNIEMTLERQQAIAELTHDCDAFIENELSDDRQTIAELYYHTDEKITEINQGRTHLVQRIEEEKRELDALVVAEKRRFNAEITELLDVLTRLQQLKSDVPPYSLNNPCFLEAGHYEYNGMRGKVTNSHNQFTFTINDGLSGEISELQFESCDQTEFSPTLVCLRETLDQKKKEIKTLQFYHHVIDESITKRENSLEVQAITLLFQQMETLREEIRTTNRIIFDDDQIAGAHKVLDNIVYKITGIKTRYITLQIKDAKDFIDETKQTIFQTIIHGALEPLSDGARAPFIQLFRHYVLRPVLDFLHKYTPFLRNCSMTFYASDHERAIVSKGREALNSLDLARLTAVPVN